MGMKIKRLDVFIKNKYFKALHIKREKNMCEPVNVEKLSIPKIIILGLAPGLAILLWVLFLSSPICGINFPVLLSLMLAIVLGLISTELGS